MTFWTEERTGPLIALWNEGKSGSQIAGYLGTTRNAVIGKVHRMGLAAVRNGDPSKWNGQIIRFERPSPPRRFTWEQAA